MLRMYQAEWCPSSHRVRQRLTELGVDFIAHQIQPSPQRRDAMEAAVGSRVIPVVVLEDGTVLDGDAEQIIVELDRRFPKGAHAPEHYELRYKARDFETDEGDPFDDLSTGP